MSAKQKVRRRSAGRARPFPRAHARPTPLEKRSRAGALERYHAMAWGARGARLPDRPRVLSYEQRMAIVRGYASTAGFAREQVNKAAAKTA